MINLHISDDHHILGLDIQEKCNPMFDMTLYDHMKTTSHVFSISYIKRLFTPYIYNDVIIFLIIQTIFLLIDSSYKDIKRMVTN